MTRCISALWRHPVKGIGAEPLDSVSLVRGQTLTGDRQYAIAQEGADVGCDWAPCRNFLRGAKAPRLMAITARTEGEWITFSHPDRPDITLNPATHPDRLMRWVAPLIPENRMPPAKVVTADRGMTDSDFPSISILSTTSLNILGKRLGQILDQRRFRGNIWVDGLDPWEEFDWIGKTLRIGTAELQVVERIGRCRATMANPETGRVDANTLDALEEGWNHTEFGVYAVVSGTGSATVGDEVTLV